MGSAVLSLQSIPLRLLPCLDRSGAAEVDESAVGNFFTLTIVRMATSLFLFLKYCYDFELQLEFG